MASENELKLWMKEKNVWHPQLFNVLKAKSIFTLEDFGKLKKKEYNVIVKESKFSKQSTLKNVYNAAKPKKKKKKKKDIVNNDDDNDNDININPVVSVQDDNKDIDTTTPVTAATAPVPTNSKKKKKKKKKKAKPGTAKSKPRGKSVKEMMAEYAKQKPTGSGKTNDTVSFMGSSAADDDK